MTIRTLCASAMIIAGLCAASAASAALQKFSFSAVDASRSGYWVGVNGAQGSNGSTSLLRYDNNGVLVYAKPYGVAQGFKDSSFEEFVPLLDGGAIVVGTTTSGFSNLPPSYSLHRIDSAGMPLWSLNANVSTFGTFLLGTDNSGAAWFPASGHIYRVNGAGALTDFGQVSSNSDPEYASAVDPVSGTLYFAAADDTNVLALVQLLKYSPSGIKSPLWTAPDAATKLQFLTLGSDGNLYGIGNNASTHFAISFSPTGNVRWSTTFGSALYAFSGSSQLAKQVAAFADGTIAALDTSGALYLVKTTGQVQAIPNTAYQPSQFGDTVVSTAYPNDIILSASGSVLLRLSTTGALIANFSSEDTQVAPTALADGTLLLPIITPNGVVLQHFDRSGLALSSTPSLIASLDPPALTRLDQIGFDGAWFASAESGQGFTIDYIPANDVLFLPWFTYNLNPTGDASGLAWVTFQGSPAPGATSATLSIARSLPGTFNSGTIPNKIIGTGTFTATDCSNARLQYQFNADEFGGLGGYMPLTRIGPSTTPCIGADGKTTPAQTPDTPLQGFDANQSGSWYDPNTSGQGVEFTIIPPSATLPAGLVFGAWFTFDAPPADDPLHEHWFTLQGGITTALNGTVSLPILQSIGGSMDSLPSSSYAQVGTATLSMLSCTSATMTYQFDNSAAAKTFAGLNGTINLSKIGGCVAP